MSYVNHSKEWDRLSESEKAIIEKHQTSEVVRIGSIAKEFGLEAIVTTMPMRLSGSIRPNPNKFNNCIVNISMAESSIRQRFTLAHEIAHFLLHKGICLNEKIEDSVLYRSHLSDKLESEANRLATDIILPPSMVNFVIEEIDCYNEAQIARKAIELKVSTEALKFRIGIRD